MKWIALIAVAAGAAYLFATKKGKRLRKELVSLAHEGSELKENLGTIASELADQKLQYGQVGESFANRRN